MLDKVTFTGIDNKTDIQDLIILQQEYPFVLNVAGTRKTSKDLTFQANKDIIIQLTPERLDLYETYKEPPHVSGFHDASGGRGIVGTQWVKTHDAYFGYAGGIKEENVLEILDEIEFVNKNSFWIDG